MPTNDAPRPTPSPAAKRRRRVGVRVFAMLGIGLVLSAAAWFYVQNGKETQAQRWIAQAAAKGNIEDSTTALGIVQPLEYVDVGSQVSGQLQKIHVKLGDTVKKGQLLAEIDPTLQIAKVESDRAQLLNLKAQVAEKHAQLILNQGQYQRQKRLIAANATSQEAFQSSEAALKATEAQIAQLRAQIQQVESQLRGNEANLGYTKIYAPIDGTVVTLPARQGQTLNANQQAPVILRIADQGTMTVWTQVSEADIGRLKEGMDVYFTVLGQPNRKWRGKLSTILPTPDVLNNVVLYNALFDVENPDNALRIQMSAQVFFVHAEAQGAILVPASAIEVGTKARREQRRAERAKAGAGAAAAGKTEDRKSRGAPLADRGWVMVLKGGTTELRQVTLGVRNRVEVQILSGIEPGEIVVIGNRQPEKRTGSAARRPKI